MKCYLNDGDDEGPSGSNGQMSNGQARQWEARIIRRISWRKKFKWWLRILVSFDYFNNITYTVNLECPQSAKYTK